MLKVSYSDFKNLSWVYWLDPLKQVNQTFEQKFFKELEFDKIQLNLTRSKIIKNLSCQLSSKRKLLKEIFEKDSNGANYVGLNTKLIDNLIINLYQILELIHLCHNLQGLRLISRYNFYYY